MSHEILPAARKFDPIEHSFALTGQLLGAALGVVVGAAIVVGVALATGGIGLLAAAGIILACLGIGASVGKLLGKLLPKAKSGHISDGSPTIFYGEKMRNAARVSDPLECQDPMVALAEKFASLPMAGVLSPGPYLAVKAGLHKCIGAHAGKKIESGVQEIFYDAEMLWPSRIKDRTECDGRICEGDETILLGGETGHTRTDDEVTEDSWWVEKTLIVLDIAGMLTGLGGRKWLIIPGIILGVAQHGANLLGYKRAGFFLGLGSEIFGILGGAGWGSRTDKVLTVGSVLLGAKKQGLSVTTTEWGEQRPLTSAEKQMRSRSRQRILAEGGSY